MKRIDNKIRAIAEFLGSNKEESVIEYGKLIDIESQRFAVSQLENLKRFSFTTPTDELPMVYVQDIQHQITNLTTKV